MEPIRPERAKQEFIIARLVRDLLCHRNGPCDEKPVDSDRDVAVRIVTFEMVAYPLTAKSFTSNTLGYAWLAGLAALTQGYRCIATLWLCF